MLADFGKGSITVNSTMTFKKFLDDYFIPDYKSQVRKRTFDMTQCTDPKKLDNQFIRRI